MIFLPFLSGFVIKQKRAKVFGKENGHLPWVRQDGKVDLSPH
jgi:hypothetical protein